MQDIAITLYETHNSAIQFLIPWTPLRDLFYYRHTILQQENKAASLSKTLCAKGFDFRDLQTVA